MVKLTDRTTPLTCADVLTDCVLPFFASHAIPLGRILTARGTEYCGSPEPHQYELYLAMENSDPTRTKGESPPTTGSCARCHRTRLNDFSRSALRKKRYEGIEELQREVDAGVQESNELRPHQGRWG